MNKSNNLIIIGSGVGCCCFLINFIKYNKKFTKDYNILIIEKGEKYTKKESILNKDLIYNSIFKEINKNNEAYSEGGYSAYHDKGLIYYKNKYKNLIYENLEINNNNFPFTLCKKNNNKYEIKRLYYYLKDILIKFNNIKIIYNCEVLNIIINNKNKAIGVEVNINNNLLTFKSKDVLLCSGTLNTYKILKKTIIKYDNLNFINEKIGKSIFFNRNLLFLNISINNRYNHDSIIIKKKYTIQKTMQMFSKYFIYKDDNFLNFIKNDLKYILTVIFIYLIIILNKIKKLSIKIITIFFITIIIILLIIILLKEHINIYNVLIKEKLNKNNSIIYNNNKLYLYHENKNINKKLIKNIEKENNVIYIMEYKPLPYLQGGFTNLVNKNCKFDFIDNLYICDSSILKPSKFNPIGQIFIKSMFCAKNI